MAIALAAELGTYTFSNGRSVAAIAIAAKANQWVEKPSKQGLELVIVPDTIVDVQPLLGGYCQRSTGQIILRQWDKAQTTTQSRVRLLAVLWLDFPELELEDSQQDLSSEKLEERIETFSILVSQSALII